MNNYFEIWKNQQEIIKHNNDSDRLELFKNKKRTYENDRTIN